MPARFRVPLAGPDARVAVDTEIELDRQRAILRRRVGGTIPVRVSVPLSSYRGIAARLFPPTGSRPMCVSLELVHDDPALVLPLFVAYDTDDLVAEWRCWADRLFLPLLIIDEAGEEVRISGRLGGVRFDRQAPRRRGSYFAARRPRFLVRRKTGRPVPSPSVAAHEIIARH
ncbi:MAG: hypothetical protein KDJ16_11110 [Hyphomicrobiales bacterium]|nr:hypothetical protein [Hyphomicrobiales bacterium]